MKLGLLGIHASFPGVPQPYFRPISWTSSQLTHWTSTELKTWFFGCQKDEVKIAIEIENAIDNTKTKWRVFCKKSFQTAHPFWGKDSETSWNGIKVQSLRSQISCQQVRFSTLKIRKTIQVQWTDNLLDNYTRMSPLLKLSLRVLNL